LKRTTRQRVDFFVGPSVPLADFHSVSAAIEADVRVLPPIQRGDLLRLLDDPPDVVGIIDGYFFQAPAVLHKEILLAMERGIRVLGAASLGALRAAELDVYGMEGIGEIYALYKRGRIDGDDEVAVLHADEHEGYRPLTDALINLRHNLRRATARRVISARTASAILEHARHLSFSERTRGAILEGAERLGSPREELESLRRFLRYAAVDLKRDDALALVRTVADRLAGSRPWPQTKSVRVNRTKYLQRYLHEYAGHEANGRHVPDALTLSFYKLLSDSSPRLVERVGRRCLAVDEALTRGLEVEDAEVLLSRYRRRRGLEREAGFERWLGRNHLSREELAAGLRDLDVEERVLALYQADHPLVRSRTTLQRRLLDNVAARNGIDRRSIAQSLLVLQGIPWDGPLLRELKMRGQFGAALKVAARILDFNDEFIQQNPWLSRRLIPRARLDQWFARRWRVEKSDLERSILARGFGSYDDFVEPARYAFVYERFGQD
jgi:hypothetical protein